MAGLGRGSGRKRKKKRMKYITNKRTTSRKKKGITKRGGKRTIVLQARRQ